jgi:hypothetical protein
MSRIALALLLLGIATSCLVRRQADFSDDEDALFSMVNELDQTDSLSIQFIGCRIDYFRHPEGFYLCREIGVDSTWIVYVKSPLHHEIEHIIVDSVCVWIGDEVIQEARKHWLHEDIERFQQHKPFWSYIELMENFGLFSVVTENGSTKIRKLYRNGDYRDLIMEQGSFVKID